MQRTTIFYSLFFLAATGCDHPGAAIDRGSAEIVNGSEAPMEHHVVALVVGDHLVCSGTLVSPMVVVTAAHCVYPNIAAPADSMTAFFGPSTRGPGMSIPVVDGTAHPGWSREAYPNDIAVLRLAEPAPVEPATLPDRPMPDEHVVGEVARLYGYGMTSSDGDGVGIRRSGEMFIVETTDKTLSLTPNPSATCSGDSGGPLFLEDAAGTRLFFGVHSRSNCEDLSISERIDAHLEDFILPFIDKASRMEPAAQQMTEEAAPSGCQAGSGGGCLWMLLLALGVTMARRLDDA